MTHTVVAPDGEAGALDRLFSSISCAVLGAGEERLPSGGRLARGAQDHYRLYVSLEGAASVVIEGHPHRLVPEGVVLVPPGVPHEARTTSEGPLTAYIVDFVARLHGILDVPAFCGFPVAVLPSPLRRPKIAASALAIVIHLTRRIPGYQLAIHTHCLRLLDLLWKETLAAHQAPGAAPGARAPAQLRFGPAFRLVEERYTERLTLAELAATAHLHPAYFSTLFKQLTGIPPLHYLARYRLERARDLLLATDRPLEDIARLTGFCDAAHLIRVFRRHEGVSPGRYRRSHAA